MRQKALVVGKVYKIEKPPFDHAVFRLEKIEDEFVRGIIIVSVPSKAEDIRIQRTTNRSGLSCRPFIISLRIGNETRTMTWNPLPFEALVYDKYIAISEILVRAEL